MIYDTKEAFLAIGVEPVTPSPYAINEDCCICLQPLDMLGPGLPIANIDPTFSEQQLQQNGSSSTTPIDLTATFTTPTPAIKSSSTGLHPATRILACRHTHGTECLRAWLRTGNTCPAVGCSRILFTPPHEQPIQQDEVDAVVRDLAPYVGEESLYAWVARHMRDGMVEETMRRRAHERQVAVEEVRRQQREAEEREGWALREEDFDEGEAADAEGETDSEVDGDGDGDVDDEEGDEFFEEKDMGGDE